MDPFVKNHRVTIQPSLTISPSESAESSKNTIFVASTVVHSHQPPVVNNVAKECDTTNLPREKFVNSRLSADPSTSTQISGDEPNHGSQQQAVVPTSRSSIDAAVYSESTLPIESARGRGRLPGSTQAGASLAAHEGARPASQDMARLDASFLSRNRQLDDAEQHRAPVTDAVEQEGQAEAARLKQISLKNLRRTIRSSNWRECCCQSFQRDLRSVLCSRSPTLC